VRRPASRRTSDAVRPQPASSEDNLASRWLRGVTCDEEDEPAARWKAAAPSGDTHRDMVLTQPHTISGHQSQLGGAAAGGPTAAGKAGKAGKALPRPGVVPVGQEGDCVPSAAASHTNVLVRRRAFEANHPTHPTTTNREARVGAGSGGEL
jgi:hypothetical protein